MNPSQPQAPQHAQSQVFVDLTARLQAMHSLLENSLAHLDAVDATGIKLLRQRLDTTRREFEANRHEADAAHRRMCAYANHGTNQIFDDTQNNPLYREIAVEKSQSYAQDAILLAMIALEEAELATLEAILNKVEADQLATKE